jgi:hypothetical protein
MVSRRILPRGTSLIMADIWDGLTNKDKHEILGWLKIINLTVRNNPGAVILLPVERVISQMTDGWPIGHSPRYYGERIREEHNKLFNRIDAHGTILH